MIHSILISPIQSSDNIALAQIIRMTLEEFGANHPGTVYFDDTTDHLFELFNATPQSQYLVVKKDGKILGGAGIFPTEGLPKHTCELVKMYLMPEARGTGLGKQMINLCFELAKEKGFKQIYLETMPELKKAIVVYEKFGFSFLKGPMGNSGHNGCAIWMLKTL